MTIAAITEKYDEKQLAGFFPGAGADIRWVLLRQVEAAPEAEVYLDLAFTNEPSRCAALNRLQPALIIVNAVAPTLEEIGYPFVRINGWPGFLERSVHELVVPDETTARRIARLYEQLGHDHRLVPDTPGMITARILSAIINEAYYTWEEEVSTKEEIDTAMRLGTNYPLGPFEWSERIGPGQIAGLLWSLTRTNPAYAPAKALQRAAEGLKYD
jgi:3-hydroxybutyryl-CoA dehydrogenase